MYQVRYESSGNAKALKPAKSLDSTQFRRTLDADTALKIISLSPLFIALNDTPQP